MAIQIKKKYLGQQSTSALSGQIRFETDNNRLVIYDGTKELLVLDETGLLFSDGVNRRIKIGNSPDDDRVGIWQSKPGEDVIELLGG